MEIKPEEAKQDLSDYMSLMMKVGYSNYALNKVIDIEVKYFMYGYTPEMVTKEISKYITIEK